MGQQMKCLVLIALVVFSGLYGNAFGLSDNYYASSCPSAESTISSTVSTELDKNLKLAAGIIRLQFHDCFVEGCDASVLLDGSGTEKTAEVNENLAGFDVIDTAKAAVEAICPGVVSCADVIAYAARDSTVKLGGSSWSVQGGRKDGFSSSASQAENDIPPPEFQVSELISSFARRGLSTKQMVILSGSHTVGVGHCALIVGRLYPTVDPTLDAAYAEELKTQCPESTFSDETEVFMDVNTPGAFDANYYTTLQASKGLFTSDQSLFLDGRTQGIVNSLAGGGFDSAFGEAMIALAAVGVKTGSQGNIRTNCRST